MQDQQIGNRGGKSPGKIRFIRDSADENAEGMTARQREVEDWLGASTEPSQFETK